MTATSYSRGVNRRVALGVQEELVEMQARVARVATNPPTVDPVREEIQVSQDLAEHPVDREPLENHLAMQYSNRKQTDGRD